MHLQADLWEAITRSSEPLCSGSVSTNFHCRESVGNLPVQSGANEIVGGVGQNETCNGLFAG